MAKLRGCRPARIFCDDLPHALQLPRTMSRLVRLERQRRSPTLAAADRGISHGAPPQPQLTARLRRRTPRQLQDQLGAETSLAVLDERRQPNSSRAGFIGATSTPRPPRACVNSPSCAPRVLSGASAAGWRLIQPLAWSGRQVPLDRTRALTREQIASLWRRQDVALRERALWRLLYETAARANEILSLDINDLDLPNKRARVQSKGGADRMAVLADGRGLAPPTSAGWPQHRAGVPC